MDNTDENVYTIKDIDSIVSFAQRIVGKSLRDVCDVDDLLKITGREDRLGDAVERFFFGCPPSSNPEAKLAEIGVELKTVPLKRTRKGTFVSKERLDLSMIDYSSVIDETWDTSSFLKKNRNILLMAYFYDSAANPVDYVFQFAELWSIPEEDLYTIHRDWEVVVEKVRAGFAHTISSGDTLYLEACSKLTTDEDMCEQPFSDIPAKQRMWALKKSYMATVTQKILDAQKISRNELQARLPLSELVHQHFENYFGYTEEDLAVMFSLIRPDGRKPKNLCALITKKILGIDAESKILEFEKAGINTKTMHIKRNGVPKEAVSFPKFDYCALANTNFENSNFLGYLEKKYLFVIFREDDEVRGEYRIDDVLFWQMPESDLTEAKRCYDEMRYRVRTGHADLSVRSTENRCCHVRPHGRDSNDTCMTPYGVPVVKKCFWLNASYIGAEIKRLTSDKS